MGGTALRLCLAWGLATACAPQPAHSPLGGSDSHANGGDAHHDSGAGKAASNFDVFIEVVGGDIRVNGAKVDRLPAQGKTSGLKGLRGHLKHDLPRPSGRRPSGSFMLVLPNGTTVAEARSIIVATANSGFPLAAPAMDGTSVKFEVPVPGPMRKAGKVRGRHPIGTDREAVESVYVYSAGPSIHVSWLRVPPGGFEPNIIHERSVRADADALGELLQAECGPSHPCEHVAIEIDDTAPFARVIDLLGAFHGATEREWGPLVQFGTFRRREDGKPRYVVRPGGISGRLPPALIQKVVRGRYGAFRLCYEQGLARDPKLTGRVSVRFVIERDGSVSRVANGASDIPDPQVIECVISEYKKLEFPEPMGGIVTVVYPIMFSPGDPEQDEDHSKPQPGENQSRPEPGGLQSR